MELLSSKFSEHLLPKWWGLEYTISPTEEYNSPYKKKKKKAGRVSWVSHLTASDGEALVLKNVE